MQIADDMKNEGSSLPIGSELDRSAEKTNVTTGLLPGAVVHE